jgi:hypothetical protein
MANTIKVKRSAVASKVPTTGDLQLGELAINTYDGKLFLKKDNGTASIVEVGASGLGTMSTQNANSVSITGGSITGITDIIVSDGGTGVSSFTAYSVLLGGTTSTGALQNVSGLGTSGQVLTSNGAGAAPSWAAVTASASGGMFWENDITLTSNYTITTNKNAMTAGPVTINAGVTVTVPSTSTWTIV